MAQVSDKNITRSDEISLKGVILKIREWRKYLRLKWKVILIVAIICGLLGICYSYLKKTTYLAELSFALQEDNNSMGGLGAAAGLASQFGLDLGGSNVGGAFSGDNILELMKSRSMIETALLTPVNAYGKQQTLAQLYISFNKYHERWADMPALKAVDFAPGADRLKFTLQQDSVLGAFYKALIKKNLTVEKLDKKLSIIKVKVTSKDELFSKYFTENLVKTVSNFYIETKTKKASKNVMTLQHLTDSVRNELNNAVTGVASTSDVNPNPNPALQILRVPSQHRQIDVEANTAILTELVKNLELAKISLTKETPLIQIIDKPILPLEKEHIGKLLGLILGAFIGVFFTVLYLVLSKTLKELI